MSDATQIITTALDTATAPCLTSSFQAECVVLNHMLRQQRPALPVLFLETYHHFPQTLAYRDELSRTWGLNLINLQAAEPRLGLWKTESTQALPITGTTDAPAGATVSITLNGQTYTALVQADGTFAVAVPGAHHVWSAVQVSQTSRNGDLAFGSM